MRQADSQHIRPTWAGTAVLLSGCLAAFFAVQDMEEAYPAARLTALILLAGLCLAAVCDWRKGLRNLIRVDLFALLALYFLLYFEFLFPQPRFAMRAIPVDVLFSIRLTLLGFAALAVGRHIRLPGGHALDYVAEVRLRPMEYVWLLAGCFVLANLYMWLSVDFNPYDWFQGLLKTRFGTPWARGRYGDARALVSELSLFGYLIPPIAGLILARRRDYRLPAILFVLACLAIQCFVAFAGGTRNVLAVYIAGFIGSFLVMQERLRLRMILVYAGAAALVFVVLASYMLEFRNIGLGRYVEEGRYLPSYRAYQRQYIGEHVPEPEGYSVDSNLFNISRLVAVFPSAYAFIGWNMPFVALTKPVPRVLWPSKPVDFAVGMEEALGISGMTISATFIGESYIAFGAPGVGVIGLLLGLFCSWWNQLGGQLRSPPALAVYTSGFFAVLITMRGLVFFTTALLPTAALLAIVRLLYLRQRGAVSEQSAPRTAARGKVS